MGAAVLVEESPSLDHYDDKYLACRDLRHAWQATSGYYLHEGSPRRHLKCPRCKTKATDTVGFDGKVKRRYDYPDDYHLNGRVYAVDVREEVLKRVKVYKDEASMLRALNGGSQHGRRATPTGKRKTAPAKRVATPRSGGAKVIDLRTSRTQRHAIARKRAGARAG